MNGKNESMKWVVGEEVGAKEQNWASTKARFYTLTAFTL
jgi:hypothetical protein